MNTLGLVLEQIEGHQELSGLEYFTRAVTVTIFCLRNKVFQINHKCLVWVPYFVHISVVIEPRLLLFHYIIITSVLKIIMGCLHYNTFSKEIQRSKDFAIFPLLLN